MGLNDQIHVRADEDLVERLDSAASGYEMDQSKFVRLLVRNYLDKIEEDGLDAALDETSCVELRPKN